jgi:hypothetical protein
MHTWMHPVDEAPPPHAPWVGGNGVRWGWIGDIFVKIKCLQEAMFIRQFSGHDLTHELNLLGLIAR